MKTKRGNPIRFHKMHIDQKCSSQYFSLENILKYAFAYKTSPTLRSSFEQLQRVYSIVVGRCARCV